MKIKNPLHRAHNPFIRHKHENQVEGDKDRDYSYEVKYVLQFKKLHGR